MKIVALTGPKGSGKDTVAEAIKSIYGHEYDVESIAFADPIKKVIQHIFNLDVTSNDEYDRIKRTDIEYYLPDIGHKTVPGRHVVREIGMMMRNYNVNQFTDYVDSMFTLNRMNDRKIMVVTDLRFDNEYMMLKSWGSNIVKIIRPQYHYDGHITERGFDDHLVNHILMNDGSLEYLNTRIRAIMKTILGEGK
jgi:hypothetical protein